MPLIGRNQRRIQRSLINRSLDVGVLPSLGCDRRRLAHAAFPLRRGLLGVRLLRVPAGEAGPFARMEVSSRLKKAAHGRRSRLARTPMQLFDVQKLQPLRGEFRLPASP
ncbi:hypothetical protein [Aquimonas sp.]|uniref:hypothetical protein n=1 Tax=Aquimonas sp. TaxID=1872588 RepID=UPI0037BEFC3E